MTIKFKLSDLNMDEVSFVSAGDNPAARICMTKGFAGIDAGPFAGIDKVQVMKDGNDLYLKTEGGKLFVLPEASVSKAGDSDVVEAEEAVVLIEDINEINETEEDAEGDPVPGETGGEEGESEEGTEQTTVDKAKFAEMFATTPGGLADKVYEEMYQLVMTLRDAVDSEMLNGSATKESLKASLNEFNQVVNSRIENDWLGTGAVLKLQLEERGAHDVSVGFAKGTGTEKEEGNMSGIARDKLTKEEVTYLDGLETELEKLRTETGTVEKSEFEKALDALPEPVRKQMIADREEVAKLRDEREEQEFITKARGLEAVPGVSPVEFGKVLRRISKGTSTPEDEAFVLESMRSANELAKNGSVLTDRISEAVKSNGGNTARAQLMQKAREYAAQHNVPEEVAVGKVRKDPTNRELVAKDREEMEEVNS